MPESPAHSPSWPGEWAAGFPRAAISGQTSRAKLFSAPIGGTRSANLLKHLCSPFNPVAG
jgi:hypothetical protein